MYYCDASEPPPGKEFGVILKDKALGLEGSWTILPWHHPLVDAAVFPLLFPKATQGYERRVELNKSDYEQGEDQAQEMDVELGDVVQDDGEELNEDDTYIDAEPYESEDEEVERGDIIVAYDSEGEELECTFYYSKIIN